MNSFPSSVNIPFAPNNLHSNHGTGHGIGIANFFQRKNFLITGATGFLAKVLIEKILRVVPDVGKIFLLIKAKDEEEAMKRLKSEIMELELFKCLEKQHGKAYKGFMMSKLLPVVGNICKSNLGMDDDTATEIAKQVNVIVSSAAKTTWDERYDTALETNTGGPHHLLIFAMKCKKLDLFLHISTMFVNRERQGLLILEKPFCMGDNIAIEKEVAKSEPLSLEALDVDNEFKVASMLLMESVHESERIVTQKMKELGQERARMYGWKSVYGFTKAMGEMIINKMRGDVPVVIIRTSFVESTIMEPFPGWIQGYRMMDPIILTYGKGQLPGFVGDPKTIVDIVPADMVVNAAMAAMAKHGNARKPGLGVYQVTSSVVNPIVLGDIMERSYEYFTTSPLLVSQGKKIKLNRMKLFNSINSFSSYTRNEIVREALNFAIRLAELYATVMFYQERFEEACHQRKIDLCNLMSITRRIEATTHFMESSIPQYFENKTCVK